MHMNVKCILNSIKQQPATQRLKPSSKEMIAKGRIIRVKIYTEHKPWDWPQHPVKINKKEGTESEYDQHTHMYLYKNVLM